MVQQVFPFSGFLWRTSLLSVEGRLCRQEFRFGIMPDEPGVSTLAICVPQPELGLEHDCVFHRAEDDAVFSPQDRQLCEQLVPHLIESQAINRLLGVARLSSQHRGPHRSLGIVDIDGVLHYQEGEFGVQLRREWPDWQGVRLPLPLCRALLDDNQELYIGRLLVLTRMLEDDLLILRVRPRLPVDSLSSRQLLVALQAARGLSHKEVARKLGIAPATVRNHIQAIHVRLRVHNRTELVEQLQLAGY
jgi:DNA-binding CsgD family transcriptional regulator